jgi:zinc protease
VLSELLYPEGHPYRWPVIGYMDDIRNATLEMVKDFFRTYYAPSNAVLTLVGDIDPDDALKRVERYFADIPAGPPITRPEIAPLQLDSERRETLEDHVRLARIYLGFHGPAYGQPGWYTADLLAAALGSGKASLFYQDLVVKRRLAQHLSVYTLPTESAATFGIIASVQPDQDPAELEAAIGEHLEAIAEGRTLSGSLEDHVERARNRRLTSHFNELQELSERADQISKFATFFGEPGAAFSEIDRYRHLEASDLRTFARDYLRPEQKAVVTVVPRD